MNILGISAFYHDSAACLLRDGEIIAAAQEERFTRKKHDFSFPSNAINYCLEAGIIIKSKFFPKFISRTLWDFFIRPLLITPALKSIPVSTR
jgi:carbamoyltransferase